MPLATILLGWSQVALAKARLTLATTGFKVIQENGELIDKFKGQKFNRATPRLDGTTNIPETAIKTTILEKQ
ncbi:MAG TPA: hypothetical protein ENJ95_11900 [Bacteroidetes bacterium]|nr:hypothetical protein [Bacteroidota bacterium]